MRTTTTSCWRKKSQTRSRPSDPFTRSSAIRSASCEPGSTQCDLDVVETCNEAGTEWEQGAACEFGCDAGACLVCAEGDIGCLGDAARVCDMNAWELVQNPPASG